MGISRTNAVQIKIKFILFARRTLLPELRGREMIGIYCLMNSYSPPSRFSLPTFAKSIIGLLSLKEN